MSLAVAGFIEIDPSRFSEGVLADAFDRFLAGDAPIKYGKGGNIGRLGKVHTITDRGDHVVITATLDTPPAGTTLKDAFNKVASGSIRGLACDGQFGTGSAVIRCFNIVSVPVVPGSGMLTSIGPSDDAR